MLKSKQSKNKLSTAFNYYIIFCLLAFSILDFQDKQDSHSAEISSQLQQDLKTALL